MNEGYISQEEYNHFISSIRTIAVYYDRDYHSVLEGKMTVDDFCLTYGHLRAGTYNIRSPRYDQMEQLFIHETIKDEDKEIIHEDIDIDARMSIAIEKALIDAQIGEITGDEVINFIKQATEQREYFKFVFTKSLSFAIELIKQMGQLTGIGVNDLSYIEVPEIYASEYYSDLDRLCEFWNLIINKRRELFKNNSEMILPAVIYSEQDFNYIENIESRPNFITDSIITGLLVLLEDDSEESIDGKIVVIEKADPGYDWIFSKGIIGLVTKYGGAASHMAIRCAEFKIPAAIGCGSNLYEYALSSKKLTIDCKHEKLIKVE